MDALKKVFYIFALLSLFSAPVTGWAEEPTYQVTAAQLTQLESIFQQLRTAQTEQAKQIETLKTQLTASENQIRQSQTSLQKANQSLQTSAPRRRGNVIGWNGSGTLGPLWLYSFLVWRLWIENAYFIHI